VDRLSRKELKKSDVFQVEVQHGVEYVAEHRQQMIRYGAIAAAVLVLAGAVYAYTAHQHNVRQSELRTALDIANANVGSSQSEFVTSFPTQEEKDKAMQKAFSELASKYPNSEEGAIAKFYLGVAASDRGDVREAEKWWKQVSESGYKEVASQAKFSLAQIYASQGRLTDAETLLRGLMDHPTAFVSTDQAKIALARLIAPSRPEEARKLLEPLRTKQGAVGRIALTVLSEIPNRGK
jgi:TolA-binding protein